MLTIYTMNITPGDSNLSEKAMSLLNTDNTVVIVIGVENSKKHIQPPISIKVGDSVRISDLQIHNAQAAFARQINDGGYTSATVAAIQTLQNSGEDQQQNGNN